MELEPAVKSAMNIAKKTNYLNNNYQYLKNVTITEWDIKSAGLSVLKFRKLLPEAELQRLSNLDKHTRTVQEGLLQRNHPEIARIIIETLSQAMQYFVVVNNIHDDEILSIKKDAMFLINKIPEQTNIKGTFEFRKKNTYTSYIHFSNSEFYYDSSTDKLDIKGISKNNVQKQEDYLLKDIRKYLRSAERLTAENMFVLLKNYRQKYLNRELPTETYRELIEGKFRMSEYMLENIPDSMIDSIDISQNYMNFILPLIQATI